MTNNIKIIYKRTSSSSFLINKWRFMFRRLKNILKHKLAQITFICMPINTNKYIWWCNFAIYCNTSLIIFIDYIEFIKVYNRKELIWWDRLFSDFIIKSDLVSGKLVIIMLRVPNYLRIYTFLLARKCSAVLVLILIYCLAKYIFVI